MSSSVVKFNQIVAERCLSFDGMQDVANLVIQARDWTAYFRGSVGDKFNRVADVFADGRACIFALEFVQRTKDLFKTTPVYELGSVVKESYLATQVQKIQKIAAAVISYHTTLSFLRDYHIVEISQAAFERWDGVMLALKLFSIGHWVYTEAAKLYTGKITGKVVVLKEDKVEVKEFNKGKYWKTLLTALSASLLFLSLTGTFAALGPFWVLFIATVRLVLSLLSFYLEKAF